MGDPTTTNATATTINALVNEAVKDAETLAEKTVETALEADIPFVALPVIKQLEEGTINLLVGELGKQVSIGLQTVGTFIVIDTQVSGENAGVSKELAAYMIAEKSGDPNAIKTALQNLANANSALDHDDGSAPPIT